MLNFSSGYHISSLIGALFSLCLYPDSVFRYDRVMLNISTKTILLIGFIQCIILTLVLILFFQYQRSLETDPFTETSENETAG